jgi:hypothetical protein
MIKIEHKCISAKIITDSITESGDRFTTFEFEYPRYIHGEVMTHRQLSKNASSSRAVPFTTNVELIKNFPAIPVHWGKNQAGMVANEELDQAKIDEALTIWLQARDSAIEFATKLHTVGLHKQIVNRILEPWSIMKTVISGTEWANFNWLRNHGDSQPEFYVLAKCAKQAMDVSVPQVLKPGQWHLPYLVHRDGEYWIDEETQVDLETAKMISASAAAQVSYRKLDDSIEKAQKIFSMLNLTSNDPEARLHASPVEHLATPMAPTSIENYINLPFNSDTWEPGITLMRRNGSLWSGNLQGWIQYRQLFKNEAKW